MKIKTTTNLRWPTSWFFLYKKNKIKPFPIEKSDGRRGPPNMKTTRDFTKPHRRTFFSLKKEEKLSPKKSQKKLSVLNFPASSHCQFFFCVCVCVWLLTNLSLARLTHTWSLQYLLCERKVEEKEKHGQSSLAIKVIWPGCNCPGTSATRLH